MQRLLWLVLLFPFAVHADDFALETDSISKDYARELPRIAPTEPADSIGKFQVAPGFRIELAANEPLVSDPISMAFDEHGRLFVVCMRGYSEHREDQLGVVRMLEDTNNDGVFDRGTDYVKDLAWPTAVACYDGGVFIGAPPLLLYCKDTDSDGVADVQKTLFKGFGHQNVQGMMNSFRWGLDNRLYGAAGTNGGQVVLADGRQVSLRGRDFSIDPATSTLRAESGGAQHGATFDRWGERFVCSNSNHLQWVELADRHLQRNRLLNGYSSRKSIGIEGPSAEVYRTSPVEPWRIVRTRLRVKGMVSGPVEGGGRAAGYFTSASGVTVYNGDAFDLSSPDHEYLAVGDVGSNLVHWKELKADGLDRTARRATADGAEFITSTDNWFRPVQFANGPDGTLYVIDMYRETIEHPLSLPPVIKQHVDLNSGRSRGRIYRVAPVDWRSSQREMPGNAKDAELVAMLSHPNGWHRETAARLICQHALASEARRESLAGRLATACEEGSPYGRIRSMYCLQSLARLSEGRLVQLLSDPHPQVRRHALMAVESASVGEAVVSKLQAMEYDPDVAVRYQLVFTLGSLEWDTRGELLARMALQASDPKMKFAILSSMGERRLEMLQLLLGEPSWGDAGELVERIVQQIGRERKHVGRVMQLLERKPANKKQRLVHSLLVGVGLSGEKLLTMLTEQHVERASELVTAAVEASQHQSLDESQPVNARVAAIGRLSLSDYARSKSTFQELLSPQQPAAIRDAVVNQFDRYTSPEVASLLADHLSSLSPTGRRRALDLIVARTSWAKQLLARVADGTLPATQVSARHRQSLLRHRDKDVARLAKTHLGGERDRVAVVARYSSVLRGSGDVGAGREVFRKICASCHRLDGEGAKVGPDLQPLRNRGAEFMLLNILDPNREVDARYEAYHVLTTDGRSRTGILTSDTDASVTLLLADGTKATIDKEEIEELVATGQSLMPEGMERELGEQGIADVIAYLIQSETSTQKAIP